MNQGRVALLVIGSLSVHWMLCHIVASSWWVPDLTLLAVVLVSAASPKRWWLAAGLAGLLTMGWTVRFPCVVLLWYGTLGVTVSVLSDVLDVGDRGVQFVLVGVAEALWIVLHLWLRDALVFPWLGVMVVPVGLTVLMVPVVRRLVGAFHTNVRALGPTRDAI